MFILFCGGLPSSPETHGSVLESLVAQETMANELVDKGEDHCVGGCDSVETAARREREHDAGSKDEEEESSCEQVHPHGSLSMG